MNALTLELQRDSMDSSVALTDLLRKALVVARKLKIAEFQRWVECELNGYRGAFAEIPTYREVRGDIKAWNPYNGWIPVIIQSEKLSASIRKRKIGQPISELESLVKDKEKGGVLHVSFPQAIENVLLEGQDVVFRPTLHISGSQIHGILDVVRNTVLNWAMKLEEEGILGEGLTFSHEERQKAQGNPSISIGQFQGILGNVADSNITQNLEMSVQPGDFKTLAEFLENKKVGKEDISELEEAIGSDPKPESDNKFGEKVSSWIGKMIKKAASGAWQIGITAAGNILSTAIKTYYGF
jgi:hypothetical protein